MSYTPQMRVCPTPPLIAALLVAPWSPAGCADPGSAPVCQLGTDGCGCIAPDLCVQGLVCASGVCAIDSAFPTTDVTAPGDAAVDSPRATDDGATDAAAEFPTAPGAEVVQDGVADEGASDTAADLAPETHQDAASDASLQDLGVPDTITADIGVVDPPDAAPDVPQDDGAAGSCSAGYTIGCGDVVDGETGLVSTWGDMNLYSCTNAYADNADEHVYGFQVSANAAVTVTLTPLAGDDLNIWLLQGACDPDSCIDYSHDGDPEVVTFNASSGLDYYIVVDGWSFHTGPYTLQVECD